MKKELIAVMATVLCFTSMAADAAPRRRGGGSNIADCAYTPLQELVRTVRDAKDIQQLMERGVQMDDPSVKCGGNLLQLAIRRGNPAVVDLILKQSPERAKETVSLAEFNIPGAPESVPVIMFAGFYAPSEQIFQLVANASGDTSVIDDNGNTVLWYMEQNPVLLETGTMDDVRNSILIGYSQSEENSDEAEDKPAKSDKDSKK